MLRVIRSYSIPSRYDLFRSREVFDIDLSKEMDYTLYSNPESVHVKISTEESIPGYRMIVHEPQTELFTVHKFLWDGQNIEELPRGLDSVSAVVVAMSEDDAQDITVAVVISRTIYDKEVYDTSTFTRDANGVWTVNECDKCYLPIDLNFSIEEEFSTLGTEYSRLSIDCEEYSILSVDSEDGICTDIPSPEKLEDDSIWSQIKEWNRSFFANIRAWIEAFTITTTFFFHFI